MSLIKNDIFSQSFSNAGKVSLKIYNICFRKKTKKENVKNLIYNRYLSVTKKLEDEPNILKFNIKNRFLDEEIEKSELLVKAYRERNKNLFKGKKYKYHKNNEKLMNLKRKKMKLRNDKDICTTIFSKPSDTSNKRNMKLIFNWKKLIGRDTINKQKEKNIKNLSDLNINTYNYRQIGFIDMSKQTQRNDNILLCGDSRKINLKQYVAVNSKLEKEKWKKFCKRPLIAKSPFSSDIENRFDKNKKIHPLSSKNFMKKINYFKIDDNKDKRCFSSRKNNSAIDFNKILSRQKINKIKTKKEIMLKPELKPNYNFINERLKMFIYRKEKKVEKKTDLRDLIWEEYYPTLESLENIYGHKLKSVPNFMQMVSRQNDNELPSYMYGIHNGMCEYNPKINLIYDYSSVKDKTDIQNNKLKEKRADRNKKIKPKCLLNKFIKLYGELLYPSKE